MLLLLKNVFITFIFAEADPICILNLTGISVEGEFIMFTCQVRYKGELPPVMEWFDPGSKIPDENIIDESIAGQLTKTSIVIVATPDKLQDVYRCETKFRAPDAPDEGYAGNAPAYTNAFQADPLDIHCKYGAINVQIVFKSFIITFMNPFTTNYLKCILDYKLPIKN